MGAFLTESLPWKPPIAAAFECSGKEQCFVLLHSGQQKKNTGRYSYLALYPQETIQGDTLPLSGKLGSDAAAFDNAWFGYLGYEFLHTIENIPQETRSYITLPDVWLTRFGLILIFDNQAKTITSYRAPHIALPRLSSSAVIPAYSPSPLASLTSPMSKAEYMDIIAQTKEAIARGDFYQANITRKFVGTFQETPDAFAIFCALSKASPGAYSAFIRMQDTAIISSSPECFLKMDATGRMESRPIKGTSARFSNKTQDDASRHYLETSAKERAENLMIVDLMRNDFSRSCEPGSVTVERLFEVSTYTTLHHMESTIIGQKRTDISTLAAVRNCFPPGSMTGAPKIRAMEWCNAHEKIRRGVYSGALGWFGGDGSCDLSVVIRTLIIAGKRFEFQVGGAITADSEPENEWQETLVKAKGMMEALAIERKALKNI